jgi:hypothetical protein
VTVSSSPLELAQTVRNLPPETVFFQWDGRRVRTSNDVESARLTRLDTAEMSDAEQARAATLVQARQRGKNARRDVAQRSELRTGKLQKENSMLLQGFDVDEDSEKTVAEQLRDALAKASVRVIDLFREWGLPGLPQTREPIS